MAHNNDKTLSIIEQVFKTMPQLLDERQRRLLAARLKQCASQVFITAIDTGQLADMMDASDCKLFHVEQGKISETLEKAESKL